MRDDAGAERVPDARMPAAGIAAALLVAGASALPGIPPAPDAPLQAIVGHLRDHRGALLGQAFLLGLAAPLVVWVLAALRAALARFADRGTPPLATAGFGAALLLLATAGVGSLAMTALAWRGPDAYGPDLVRYVYDLGALSAFSLSAPFSFASVGAFSLVARRAGLLPDWLAAVAFVVLLANAAELLGLFATAGPIAAGATAGLVAIPAWGLWLAGMSVVVARPSRR
jgi:hypothetical protein